MAGTWSRIASADQDYTLSGWRMVRYGDGTNWLYRQDAGTGNCSNFYFNYWGSMKISECQVFNPSTTSAAAAMPMGGPAIDIAKVPPGAVGFSDVRLRYTGELGTVADDGTGSFRDGCMYSHMGFDDPIVKPGQPGLSHLHTFFGNTGTNAYSTASTLATTGNSTCKGGIMNRTAYWVPTMIDTLDGTPLAPVSATFYYKTGYNGIKPTQINALPAGLRMVAGDAKNASPSGPFNYSCENAGAGAPAPSQSIANCPVNTQMWMNLEFPQCWDGVNLDSPDHKSHMSYTVNGACPSTHPVAIPEISFHVVYLVKEANAPLRWRLSSDTYDSSLPGGYSSHGDWFNGWDVNFSNVWLKNCDQAARDCHGHLIGDGREMYDY